MTEIDAMHLFQTPAIMILGFGVAQNPGAQLPDA
jgi:hypothetical protein